MQWAIGTSKIINQINGPLKVEEASKRTQEEYPQQYFIPYLELDKITINGAYLHRLNTVVQMYQQMPHMNLPIGYVPRSSRIFVLYDTRAGLNLVNPYYH